LTAQHATLFDETEEDFRQFHLELMRVLQPKGAMEGAAFAARHSLRLALASRVPDRDRDVRQSAKGWAPGGATMATDIDTVYTRLSSQRDDLAKLSRCEASIERSFARRFTRS
jgi:hypothetical protein